VTSAALRTRQIGPEQGGVGRDALHERGRDLVADDQQDLLLAGRHEDATLAEVRQDRCRFAHLHGAEMARHEGGIGVNLDV